MFTINIKLDNELPITKTCETRAYAVNFLANALYEITVRKLTNPLLPDIAQMFSNAGSALKTSSVYHESRAGIGAIEVTDA